MKTQLEPIRRNVAQALAGLQAAMKSATPTEALILLTMIVKAVDLHDSIAALQAALIQGENHD